MKNPKWIFKTPPISISLSNEIASILRMTTGEQLVGERISILPLAENGIILLQENDQVLGSLLWMKINQLTARVLGFGIHPELQGNNLGSECWEKIRKVNNKLNSKTERRFILITLLHFGDLVTAGKAFFANSSDEIIRHLASE